jgi:alpha-N-arabinofuranosidase
LAGVVCYQNETFNYVFGITKKAHDFYIVLQRTYNGKSTIVASEKISYKTRQAIQLHVKANGDDYTFGYSVDGKNFKNIGGVVSGDILSTNIAGGFTGALIGLYATSDNDAHPTIKTK